MTLLLSKIFIVSHILAIVFCNKSHNVTKRALLFPRNTVLQFTYGLSVPLVLPRRSINLSLCAQVNYNEPSQLSALHTKVISAREKSNFDISREFFYKYIMAFLDSFGINGEECLLRTICEISECPMHATDSNLLEKIVHFMFTPSLEIDTQTSNITKSNLNFEEKLILAEKIGKNKGSCDKEYSECVISLVDLFTSKYIV
ncbi:unnamed protein product [Brassicogethes aeneus]|uniref:Uncharacterized protein n=1 Tax=Brassicogethes aeneus TaxID=1431903 RepID=A0A9P0AVX4_BRAAE|nr:unnamed protein product [Brassicogethes aeneus]